MARPLCEVELLHEQLRRGAVSQRAVTQRAGPLPGQRNQIGQAVRADRRVHDQNLDPTVEDADVGEVLQRVVGEPFEQARCHTHVADVHEAQRVAIRRADLEGLERDDAACRWTVLDDDRLAQQGGEPLGNLAGADVGHRACSAAEDGLDGFDGEVRRCAESGSGQTPKEGQPCLQDGSASAVHQVLQCDRLVQTLLPAVT